MKKIVVKNYCEDEVVPICSDIDQSCSYFEKGKNNICKHRAYAKTKEGYICFSDIAVLTKLLSGEKELNKAINERIKANG